MGKIKTKPTFDEEKNLWKKSFDFVIGIDEVGRGAFAGPVTVGAVVFNKGDSFDKDTPWSRNILAQINDSKLLSPVKRKQLSLEIKKQALYWSTASINVSTINKKGIGKATEIAFRKAVNRLLCHPELVSGSYPLGRKMPKRVRHDNVFVLVDGFHIRYLRGIGLKNQKAIIKGDQKSISIAAASIIAKVHRDNFMRKLHRKFPVYNFYKNKGYGTKEHQLAIFKHGLAKVHRSSFALQKFTASR